MLKIVTNTIISYVFQSVSVEGQPNMTLDAIRKVHCQLCETIEEMNSIFGPPLLCFFTKIAIITVINPNLFLMELLRGGHSFDLMDMIVYLTRMMHYILLLFFITWICTYSTYHVSLIVIYSFRNSLGKTNYKKVTTSNSQA